MTTLSFYRYQTSRDKRWAFFMMRSAHRYLKDVHGMSFYKLMGSGPHLGFSLKPDWSTYALLQSWDSKADADSFFSTSPLVSEYRNHSSERITLYLEAYKTHGTWSGVEPFRSSAKEKTNTPIAVLTRATIRTSELVKFWKQANKAHLPLYDTPGLLFTKGVGEVPFKQMATFSIWQDEAAMRGYAYSNPEHLKAMKLTRERNWYSEELFARFSVVRADGEWDGLDTQALMLA